MRPKLAKAIHVLYDKRWGEVTAFCEKLSEKLPVLEQTWSEDKFKEERTTYSGTCLRYCSCRCS